MKVNYHIHTSFSDDSVYEMEDVVTDSIEANIQEICFTDHVDYGVKKDWIEGNIQYRHGEPIANVDYPAYFQMIEKMQKKYKDQITIKKGLEYGMQTHTIPQFEKLYHDYPLDFVILSCHQVNNLEFWTQDYQRNKTQQEYNEGYYKEILNVIQTYKNYSVLGHLDAIIRYDEKGPYPFEKVKDIITEILKTVIQDGKGIEVNTSCFRYGLDDLTPGREILKLYRSLGGNIITIGSDSHKKEHLDIYIEEVKDELIQLGFTHFCTYEKMKPVYHKLKAE